MDPLANAAPSWTPDRYGFNNPISFTDPDGLFESRRAARRWKRKQKDKAYRKGKIRKNRSTGEYVVQTRCEGDGRVSGNSDGSVNYFAGGYSKNAIRPNEANGWERFRDANFGTGIAYGLLNDAWLVTQRMNPFDTHTTHLAGNYSTKNEYTMGLVNTVATAVPIGKATTSAKALTPTGVTLLQRLNAAQFSKQFKGTLLARTHPKIRGRLNRLLNLGVDQVNTRVQTGNAVILGTKVVGKSSNQE